MVAVGGRVNDAVDRVLDGEAVTYDGTIDGVRVHYEVNQHGDRGDIFNSVDYPVVVQMTNDVGLRVLAFDYGAMGTFTFRDGATRKSYVWPMNEDEDELASKITSREFDALESADARAHELSFLDNVDPHGKLSARERAEIVIKRVEEEVAESK